MTGALWQSALVAGLFALHPLNVESVAWVAERKNVLSTLFWLLTLWAYAGYVRRKSWQRYLGVMGVLVLGLMTKAMLVTLPCVLLLMDYWPLGRLGRGWQEFRVRLPGLLVEKLPFLVPVALVSAVTIYGVQTDSHGLMGLDQSPLVMRVNNTIVAYGLYLKKMVWPTDLAIFYPYPFGSLSASSVILAATVLAAISLWVWIRRWKSKPVAVGWLWFLGTLVPVNGLLQSGSQAMADRYAYVPLVGVFIMLAWGVTELLQENRQVHMRGLVALGLCALLVLAVLTRVQLRYWQNTTTLFEHALQVTSNNYIAHDVVGSELYKSQEFEPAIEHYQEALRIYPRYSQAHFNWGLALVGQGRIDEAFEHFNEAVKIDPEDYQAHYNLGVALVRQGRFEAAIEHFQATLEIDPTYSQAHHNWGLALVGRGSLEEAVEHFKEALKATPKHSAIHYDWGVALVRQGHFEEAIEQFGEAVRIDPRHPEAHHNLGVVLLRQGNVGEAIEHFKEALKINSEDSETHHNLGVALVAEGSLDEAIHHFSEALRIDPDYRDAQENLRRLQNR